LLPPNAEANVNVPEIQAIPVLLEVPGSGLTVSPASLTRDHGHWLLADNQLRAGGILEVLADAKGLSEGTYTGVVRFRVTDGIAAGKTTEVPVTLVVGGESPALTVMPAALHFSPADGFGAVAGSSWSSRRHEKGGAISSRLTDPSTLFSDCYQ
jgi:hypothetical protein